MRSDMNKCVTERPRVHGDGGKSVPKKGYSKRHAKTPPDEQPKRESMKALCGGTKSFTDVLGPIRGFLRKNCGRPWDKVYSEICQNISLDSVSQSHVRDHVDRDVEKNCTIVDGKVCTSEGKEFGYYPEFYVDPRNGILRRNKKYLRGWLYGKSKPRRKPYVLGKDKDHQYHLIRGVWYELTLAPIPEEPRTVLWRHRAGTTTSPRPTDPSMRNVLDACFSVCEQPSVAQCRKRYGRNVYCTHKRQLNKREIKRLKLWETDLGLEYKEGGHDGDSD